MTSICLLQVLSTTVAEAFLYENNPHTKETERFVRIFDKFFDLMNTRNTNEFVLKRKPNLAPYDRVAIFIVLVVAECHTLMSGNHMLTLKSI